LTRFEWWIGREVGLAGGAGGEGIAALVLGITGVAAHPAEADAVALAEGEQAGPQVRVERRLALVLHPAVGSPADGPAIGDPLHDVARVGVERNGARSREQVERGDGGGQFHAVVGGEPVTAG
jgi:hypothetical protein